MKLSTLTATMQLSSLSGILDLMLRTELPIDSKTDTRYAGPPREMLHAYLNMI